MEAAYLTLTANVAVAAITEASLRGQIEATLEIIAINKRMLEILRKQLQNGYANRNDNINVAVHEMSHALLYNNFFAQYGTDSHFRLNYEKFSSSTGPIRLAARSTTMAAAAAWLT